MTDWKRAAAAIAPDMPAEAVERIDSPLTKLEAVFRPMVAEIPLGTEPSYLYVLPVEPQ